MRWFDVAVNLGVCCWFEKGCDDAAWVSGVYWMFCFRDELMVLLGGVVW